MISASDILIRIAADIARGADALERIAAAQEMIANDDPLLRMERAIQRMNEDEAVGDGSLSGEIKLPAGAKLDDLWSRGF